MLIIYKFAQAFFVICGGVSKNNMKYLSYNGGIKAFWNLEKFISHGR